MKFTATPKPSRVARQAAEIERLTNALADATRRADGAQRIAMERRAQLDRYDREVAEVSTLRKNAQRSKEVVRALEEALRDEIAKGESAVACMLAAQAAQAASVSTSTAPEASSVPQATVSVAACPVPHLERRRLPDDRAGVTRKLRIGIEEKLCEACGSPLPGSRVSAHLTLNRYEDGRPAEMFLTLDRARRGDLAATFAHQLAIVCSVALQYNVPAEVLAARMRHVRDESGGTVMRDVGGKLVPSENPRTVGSLIDLIAVILGGG